MTEAEWDACADPKTMLDFVVGKASDRKLRLFACACCRTLAHLLKESALQGIAVAEHFADGQATDAERATAYAVARADARTATLVAKRFPARLAAADIALYAARTIGEDPPSGIAWAFGLQAATWKVQKQVLVCLRCVIGNPTRRIPFPPSWGAWTNGAIRKMAQAIYDDRRFSDLPLLADALEEAGCADAAILAHCRQPEEHVRGCWVVDLLLGKE